MGQKVSTNDCVSTSAGRREGKGRAGRRVEKKGGNGQRTVQRVSAVIGKFPRNQKFPSQSDFRESPRRGGGDTWPRSNR